MSYTAGQSYLGATVSMYPPPGESNMGNFIAFDAKTNKIVWSNAEQFSVRPPHFMAFADRTFRVFVIHDVDTKEGVVFIVDGFRLDRMFAER